ncbi:NAD-dependent epimerase/dehydratase [Flammeovirgaceae bacterium 311]|nr:NAD-dependent epimerase/dehydratase [Flammeovirgaceae bacterium 311]
MNKTVSIIGGCGFLGSYVTKKFLAEGYTVKASTRNKNQPGGFQHLLEIGGDRPLELVEMDVLNADEVVQFVKGSEVVVHCGTPFRFDVQQEQAEAEMFRPTLEGTHNVIEACQKAQGLEKLVIISSVAAINGYVPSFDPAKGKEHIFTADDIPVTHSDHPPYNQSKYRSDQLVQEYIKENPSLPFEIISLYPGLIVGKPLSDSRDSTSAGMLYLLKHKLMPNDMMKMVFEYDIEFAMVAVEDVAEAIYQGTVRSGLHGKRYIISHETWPASDVHRMLNGESTSGKKWVQYSNQKAADELGLTFTPARIPLQEYSMAQESKA